MYEGKTHVVAIETGLSPPRVYGQIIELIQVIFNQGRI